MAIKDIRCGMYKYKDAEPKCPCDYCEDQVGHGLLIRKILCALGVFAMMLFLVLMFSHKAVAADIVTIAESQIGKGEIGGNNKGAIVEKYTRGRDAAWCAGFVSWVIAHSDHRKRKAYLLSARSYWEFYKDSRTRKPRPGDVIVFYRGSRSGHSGHVGIVEEVRGNRLVSIEGNVGPYPARVKRIQYRLNNMPNLLGFVRIS